MLTVRPLAQHDIWGAYDWYEAQELTLGTDFLNEIEAALLRIQDGPTRYPIFRGNVRRQLLQRFPYSLYFRIRGEEIRILAVLHQSRGPSIVRRRIGK